MWKAGAAIVGLLLYTAGILGAVVWMQKQSYNHGQTECQLDASKAATDSLIAAQKHISKLSAELQEREKLIYEDSKDDSGDLPDSTRRQLDRMLLNQIRRDGDSN